MPLPTPGATSHWTAQIGALAEREMKCEITLYDPTNTVTIPYDSATDTGGYDAPSIIKADVPARLVFLRYPKPVNGVVDWSVSHTARIQIPLTAITTPITKGLIIRVTALGESDDPALLQVAFTVETAFNGSFAAVRTISCISSLTVTPAVV
ncbi:DUF6093 family protein [Frigoribacterium sp. UYMn621]|uniref:DUF6093 family protein n=1 Tax=Frigoribacterium sp. UYMn621 TaxID=3156343 RepID=UPI003394849D